LVQRRVEGRQHHLSLEPSRLAAAVDWLAHFNAFWDDSFEALAGLVESEKS
jgi:hypothetical protein